MSAQHQQLDSNPTQPKKERKSFSQKFGTIFLNVCLLSFGLSLIVSCQPESSQETSEGSKQDLSPDPQATLGSAEGTIQPPAVSKSSRPNSSSVNSAQSKPQVTVPALPGNSESNQSTSNQSTSNSNPKSTSNPQSPENATDQVNPREPVQVPNEFPLPASSFQPSSPEPAENKFNKYAEYSPKPKGQNIYQNKQLGFSFKYPKGYTVGKSKNNFGAKPGISQQKLDVWTDRDYQAIKAGKFRGTELPSSVSISIEKNPKGLNAQQWLQENAEEFGSTANQTIRFVAGQRALAFNTTDLYESKNIVLPTKDKSSIIIISLAENRNNLDREYKQAFDRVISSFNLKQ